MRIKTIPVRCIPCNHDFTAEIVESAPLDVSLASINVIRCPACGKGPSGLVLINQGEAKS